MYVQCPLNSNFVSKITNESTATQHTIIYSCTSKNMYVETELTDKYVCELIVCVTTTLAFAILQPNVSTPH